MRKIVFGKKGVVGSMWCVVVVIATLSIFTGCEQTVPTDDLPYVDHIVVKAYLVPGHALDSVSITHTLPLSVTYTPEKAAVLGASVRVIVDGRTIPLSYAGFGYYADPAHEVLASGKTYHLLVDWHGLHAEATTTVPYSPLIDTLVLDQSGTDTNVYHDDFTGIDHISFYPHIRLNFGIRPHGGEVYQLRSDTLTIVEDGESRTERDYFSDYDYSFVQSKEVSEDGHVWIRQESHRDDSLKFVAATIASFDAPYYDFRTSYGSSNNEDIFGITGTNPKWNVTGDGIGIFMGMSSSSVLFRVR